MKEENENINPEQLSEENEILESGNIGGGTPLKDEDETPLYVPEQRLEPVVGIGEGTPLFDTNEEPKIENKPIEEASKEITPVETVNSSEESVVVFPSEKEESSIEGEKDFDEKEFAEALEKSFNNEPDTGEIITGKVIRIDDESVVVDVGYKSEGVIAKEEFLDFQGDCHVNVGDEVEVLLERKENREGLLVLSKKKVDRRLSWNKAKVALANGSNIEGLVFEICKGGFKVDLGGLQAFLPGSQVDIKPNGNSNHYVGKRFQFKVIKMNRQRGNVVVSRRNHMIEEQDKTRSKVISKLTPGRLVHGVVKNITNYGVFVDIGGIDALLHINDMSWSKISNPRKIVSIGDEIETLILTVDEKTNRIALGLKQKSEDPWIDIEKKYPVGSIVEGEVVSLMEFGAFLKIEEGVEGLIPVSELSWTKRVHHSKDVLKEGDSVRVKVLTVNSVTKKITMGLRQTEPEPFVVFIENVKVGDVITGEVKTLANYGAFVELAEGVSGLLHISDLSWDNSIKKPSEVLKIGDKIQVKLLEIYQDKKKITLGLKQTLADPWAEIAQKYTMGMIVKVKVVRNTKFGVFVQLEPGIEGLIHISQIEKERGKHEPVLPEVGKELEAKIVKINKAEHKIGLSIKEFLNDQEKAEIEKYMSPVNKPGMSMAEVSGVDLEELMKRVSGKNN